METVSRSPVARSILRFKCCPSWWVERVVDEMHIFCPLTEAASSSKRPMENGEPQKNGAAALPRLFEAELNRLLEKHRQELSELRQRIDEENKQRTEGLVQELQ